MMCGDDRGISNSVSRGIIEIFCKTKTKRIFFPSEIYNLLIPRVVYKIHYTLYTLLMFYNKVYINLWCTVLVEQSN